MKQLQKKKEKVACVSFASGCLRSQMNAGLLIDYFEKNGWQVTTELDQADMIMVGTCGFQQESEDVSLKLLSIAGNRKKKGAKVIAFGCLAGINKQKIQQTTPCLPLTCREFHRLDDLIDAQVKIADVNGPNDLTEYAQKYMGTFTLMDTLRAKFRFSRNYLGECMSKLGLTAGERPIREEYGPLYNIKIASGCQEECSYCAIRFAEGKLTSKPMENILREFQNGLASGYQTFNLIGTDVGAYGQDTGTHIAALLEEILKQNGTYKIVFSDFHPRWLVKYFDKLSELFKNHAEKFGFLGFPVQSGSDRVLKLMNRNYSIADVRRCLKRLYQDSPQLQLTTHILVGFPGELEEDVDQTVEFLTDVNFNRVSVYVYSDRPGTVASTLPNKISQAVIQRRFRRMIRKLGHAAR